MESELRTLTCSLEERVDQLGIQTTILQSILNSMGDGVIVADPTGRIFLVNPAAQRINPSIRVGVCPPEFSKAFGLVLPDGITPFPTDHLPLARVLRGETVDGQEVCVREPDSDEKKWTTVTGRPLTNANGQFVGGVIVVRDDTARKSAEEALLEVQERERQRIAQELHDSICQSICLLIVNMTETVGSCPLEAGDTRLRLMNDLEKLQEVADEVAGVARSLHPAILERLGLIDALKSLAGEVGRSHHLSVEFFHNEMPRPIPANAGLAIYRVAQEALRNVVKHSRASTVKLRVEALDASVRFRIQDDGVGFDSDAAAHTARIGLTSMQERVRLANGTFELHSEPGRGTTIEIRIPARLESDPPAPNASAHAAALG